jgi:hypothetical protein
MTGECLNDQSPQGVQQVSRHVLQDAATRIQVRKAAFGSLAPELSQPAVLKTYWTPPCNGAFQRYDRQSKAVYMIREIPPSKPGKKFLFDPVG